MLINLHIENYALIAHLDIRPASELNIITGETGAGKSIMLGAVGLLLGNRADTKALSNKDKKCVIEGEFDVSQYQLQSLFEQFDLDYDTTSILRREISPAGKSRAFINDTPVTLDTMRQLGSCLMDVHSQHETLLLSNNMYQTSVIDDYAGNTSVLASYHDAFRKFKDAQEKLGQLVAQNAAYKKQSDYDNFLLDELNEAKLEGEEQAVLEEQLELQENAEEIKTNLVNAVQALSGSEYAGLNTLQEVRAMLNNLRKLSHHYQALCDRIESSVIELQDINDELERESEGMSYDPQAAEQTKERLSLLFQLQQKHAVNTVEELIAIQSDLDEKSRRGESLEDEINEAERAVEKYNQLMLVQAKALSKARLSVFKNIEKEVNVLLGDLGMKDAKLEITRAECAPSDHGIDSIMIMFSANKGVAPQPLGKVASGGEFSRLMFCVKYILADKTALPTIVFDEIDTGISGEIAIKMGEMMERMAGSHQVIVITHLPQIAARGKEHFYVYKDSSSAVAKSLVRVLSKDERKDEIAKMIGGDSPSLAAYESAAELLINK